MLEKDVHNVPEILTFWTDSPKFFEYSEYKMAYKVGKL